MKIRTIVVSLLIIALMASSVGMAADSHGNDKTGPSSVLFVGISDMTPQSDFDRDRDRDCDEDCDPDGDENHNGW